MTAAGETKSVRLPGNVAISGAGLSLKLGSNTRDTNGKRPFTGGYVRTRDFRQCYGYFECEMQIANEPGVNNAFWLTSVRETEGDTRFELDVVEAKYPNVVQVTARRWLPDREVFSKTYRPRRTRLADAYHRYGMLWSKDQFQFFFDDKKIYEVANTFAHTPAQLLFSNAVASFAGKDDGDVNGAATSIRNIRVFQNTAMAKRANLEVFMNDDFVSTSRADKSKKYLLGKNGWIFLDHDLNRVIDQITGRHLLDSRRH